MVHVDAILPCKSSRVFPYSYGCNLTADTPAELHAFAINKLQLRSSWMQVKKGRHLYRLTFGMRSLAIKLGAEYGIETPKTVQGV